MLYTGKLYNIVNQLYLNTISINGSDKKYAYIYMCVYVCVSGERERKREGENDNRNRQKVNRISK